MHDIGNLIAAVEADAEEDLFQDKEYELGFIASANDRAFITTMGFDVQTFMYILTSGFATYWDETAIPRNDANAAGALGLVLHYLNSTMREVSLQQIFAIIPTMVSWYITFSLRILLSTLQTIPEAKIKWPRDDAFGSIDGLKLLVQTSDDIDIKNATFNGWLLEHFISSVLVFSSKGVVIAARTNAPGSWHDSRVAQPIYRVLRTKTPEGHYIIADTAFPRGTVEIQGHICAPLKAGQQVGGTPDQIVEVMAFNQELLSYRQTAEWVYFKHWQQTDDVIEVWTGFESMLFSQQREKDCVACFHIVMEYE
ncbi:hypothetical protein BS17DRAFT_792928 [Gyrodon lividus]|nr:hypothetical protein BS17DRAFT_792928 [Gyrodon lividus]